MKKIIIKTHCKETRVQPKTLIRLAMTGGDGVDWTLLCDCMERADKTALSALLDAEYGFDHSDAEFIAAFLVISKNDLIIDDSVSYLLDLPDRFYM